MNYLKSFIKEWGVIFLVIALVGLSRIFPLEQCPCGRTFDGPYPSRRRSSLRC